MSRAGQKSIDLLLAVNVNVNTAVNTVVEAVVAGGLETLVVALLTAVVEAGVVATVVLVDTNVLFLGHACRATAVVLSDADVFAEAFFVTGRGGFLGSWWLLTFPSSALDRSLLFSLDLFGLLVVFVGRRKDAERDSVGWLAGCVLSVRDVRVLVRARAQLSCSCLCRYGSRLLSKQQQQTRSPSMGILTGLWRRNPAWRLLGDLNTLQDSNATCRADKPDKRQKKKRAFMEKPIGGVVGGKRRSEWWTVV